MTLRTHGWTSKVVGSDSSQMSQRGALRLLLWNHLLGCAHVRALPMVGLRRTSRRDRNRPRRQGTKGQRG